MSKKVSNDLYCIDFIMKNCFVEWAKNIVCPIYKHVIFAQRLNVVIGSQVRPFYHLVKITTMTDIQTIFHSFHNV